MDNPFMLNHLHWNLSQEIQVIQYIESSRSHEGRLLVGQPSFLIKTYQKLLPEKNVKRFEIYVSPFF